MTGTEPLGRRERKKAATRKSISDAATTLFLDRGFDAVSIREIAEQADVSPTTVFAHFPQKEALVFDEDEEQRASLVAAVRERDPGVSISEALRGYFARELVAPADEHGDEALRRFMTFVNETPALREYAQRMWTRHEDALADAVAADLGLAEPPDEVRVYARFVLQIQLLVLGGADPLPMLDAGFRILDGGWARYAAAVDPDAEA